MRVGMRVVIENIVKKRLSGTKYEFMLTVNELLELFAKNANKDAVCPNYKCPDRFTGFCVNCSSKPKSKT